MNLKIKIATVFFCLVTVSFFGQEKWTLNECVTFALQHNLQLNDFKYTAQSGKETYRQSIRELLPRVNAATDYVINFGRSTDPFTNDVVTTDFFSNRYTLQSSIDLFQGFQKLNTIKVSKFLNKATQEEALHQKYLLAFRVMQAFYDIQFFEGLTAISKEQLAVSQSNYDLVKKQIELGLKAGADLYEAESLLLTDKLNLTQSGNNLVGARLKLAQEMNLEGATDIEIQNGLPDALYKSESTVMQSDSIFNETKEFLPILKASELRVKAAKKQVAAERGGLYPSLSLFGGIGTGYFETTRDTLGATVPFRDQFNDNTFQYVGLSLNIPISNAWSARSRVKQQKIEYSRAQNNLDIQEQVVFQAIQTLVQEYNSLQVEYEQSTQKTKAQYLAFTIAQKRYEKGLINALELFTAKNLFASAQNENLQVRLRSEINKSTLDFYRGLPVFNIE
ncbi:TolC family protein [Sediminicola arcticus]|jgi:outer membrane protein|uniref:TolC family protein n=1 Tax=Sediminicola arcticus TaxID=1574308 RepID=A0ABV2SUH2_9FLAO